MDRNRDAVYADALFFEHQLSRSRWIRNVWMSLCGIYSDIFQRCAFLYFHVDLRVALLYHEYPHALLALIALLSVLNWVCLLQMLSISTQNCSPMKHNIAHIFSVVSAFRIWSLMP